MNKRMANSGRFKGRLSLGRRKVQPEQEPSSSVSRSPVQLTQTKELVSEKYQENNEANSSSSSSSGGSVVLCRKKFRDEGAAPAGKLSSSSGDKERSDAEVGSNALSSINDEVGQKAAAASSGEKTLSVEQLLEQKLLTRGFIKVSRFESCDFIVNM